VTAGRTEAAIINSPKTRRKWTASQKLKIILETLQSDRQLAAICRREGVSPNLVDQWRKQLLGSAEAVFAPKPKNGPDPRIEKLARENTRMKNVIAETTAENLELTKSSRTERPSATAARVAAGGDRCGATGQRTQRVADYLQIGCRSRGDWRARDAPFSMAHLRTVKDNCPSVNDWQPGELHAVSEERVFVVPTEGSLLLLPS
jgi:transposase